MSAPRPVRAAPADPAARPIRRRSGHAAVDRLLPGHLVDDRALLGVVEAHLRGLGAVVAVGLAVGAGAVPVALAGQEPRPVVVVRAGEGPALHPAKPAPAALGA